MSDPSILPTDAVLTELDVTEWHGPFAPALRDQAVKALESGKILFLPRLAFGVRADEAGFLTGDTAGGARKSISLDPATGQASNVGLPPDEARRLSAMIDRFGRGAETLLADLLPGYAGSLERARTSFRPTEISGRDYSPRHDDRRLHVDAFPTRPMHGRRILRVFSNVAPDGSSRRWLAGEAFDAFAREFVPRVRPALPASAWLLQRFGLTKSRRGPYDHMMLRLHDLAKLDASWQRETPRAEIAFPAGCTWLCFTDQVLHAALSGRCALEQTFHLPVEAMRTPDTAPLRVLEAGSGRRLL